MTTEIDLSEIPPTDQPAPGSSTEPSQPTETSLEEEYPQEVEVLDLDGRRVVLVGTAHISQHSVDLVRQVIERERPDRVCIELDPKRYQALSEKKQWEALDLKQIIRNKQLPTLLVNLVLASYQKRLGGQLGIEPGRELLEAAKVAEELDIPIELCDRDVRITLRRAGAATSLFRKLILLSELLASLLDSPEISEQDLAELKQKDALSELMEGLGKQFPSLKVVLIDERDAYLKEKIHRSSGDRLVAVVGAGHLQGIRKALTSSEEVDLEELEVIPPVSPWWKVVGWSVPVLILGSIGWLAWQKGLDVAGDNLLFWILANGIPTAIGAMLATAHPLTVVAGFCAAPLTSLTPVVGAHYVTAFVQAYFRPPIVKELQSVSEDIGSPRMWWKNRMLKIFLAFLLPGLGSVLGTFVGGGRIISSLFS